MNYRRRQFCVTFRTEFRPSSLTFVKNVLKCALSSFMSEENKRRGRGWKCKSHRLAERARRLKLPARSNGLTSRRGTVSSNRPWVSKEIYSFTRVVYGSPDSNTPTRAHMSCARLCRDRRGFKRGVFCRSEERRV